MDAVDARSNHLPHKDPVRDIFIFVLDVGGRRARTKGIEGEFPAPWLPVS